MLEEESYKQYISKIDSDLRAYDWITLQEVATLHNSAKEHGHEEI